MSDSGYPYGEMDAHKWAIEFDRIYPDKRPDIDTMLAWFANAIMTGYDKAYHYSIIPAPEEIECPCCKDWFTPCNDITHGNRLHMCGFCALGQHNLEAACYPSD